MGLHEQFFQKGRLVFALWQLMRERSDGEGGGFVPHQLPLTAERLQATIEQLGGGLHLTPPAAHGGVSFEHNHLWSWVLLGNRRAHAVLDAGGWLIWGRRDWFKRVEHSIWLEADLAAHIERGEPAETWMEGPANGDSEVYRALLARALPEAGLTVFAYQPATGQLLGPPQRLGRGVIDDLRRLLQVAHDLEKAPELFVRQLGRGSLPEREPVATLRRLVKADGHLIERDADGAVVGAWAVRTATDRVRLSDPDPESDLGSVTATGEIATALLEVAQAPRDHWSGHIDDLVKRLAVPGLTITLDDLATGLAWGFVIKPKGEVSRISVHGIDPEEVEIEGQPEGGETEGQPKGGKTEAECLQARAAVVAVTLTLCLKGRHLWHRLLDAVESGMAEGIRAPADPKYAEPGLTNRAELMWEGVPELVGAQVGRQMLLPPEVRTATIRSDLTGDASIGGVVKQQALRPVEGEDFEAEQAFARGVQAARSGAACAAPEHLDGELQRAWVQGWREESERLREAAASRAAAREQARGGRTAEEQAERRVVIVAGLLESASAAGAWVDVEYLVTASQGFSREQVTAALARLVALGRARRSDAGAYIALEAAAAPAASAPAPTPGPQASEPAAAPRPVRAALPSQEPSGEADEAPAPAPAPARKRRSSAEILEQRQRSQAKGAAFSEGAAAYEAGVLYDSAPAGLTGPELLGWRAGWSSAKRAAQGGVQAVDHPEDLAALPPHRRLGRAQLEGTTP